MKLAFSTLGCPGWSFDEIFATAKDLGLDGIEIRGLETEMFAPCAKPFREENIAQTKSRMEKAGLAFSMLTSGACLGKDKPEEYKAEALAYIDLAAKLGVKDVRVMCTATPEPVETDLKQAKRLYEEICEYAGDKGVFADIETNGVLADSKELKLFMSGINKGAGVLWDIHHPFRYFAETPQKTYGNIGEYVRYLHVKDSVKTETGVLYRMMGYGDVPIFDTLRLLKENGYEGFVSLEWVKRWCPELSEPGIVFAHYISYMRYLLTEI